MRFQFLPLWAAAAAAFLSGAAGARELHIVGSSTVFPFSTAVAEQYAANTGEPTPLVEAIGTGGGLRLFCGGVGKAFPDIANASRRMKGSEWDLCEANGVTEIVELEIGHDGIVLANSRRAPQFSLTEQEVFLALAAEVPVNGRLEANPFERWSDISPDLPDLPIEVFGPPPSSGTRDAFVEIFMEGGAGTFPLMAEMKAEDPELFLSIAHAIRADGKWIDAGENDGAVVQTLVRNREAVGVFGWSFLVQNADRLRGATMDGVSPGPETIADGRYHGSRLLYNYVKRAHLAVAEGLPAFLSELTSDDASGPEGYLAEKGLIPLSDEERKVQADKARALRVMTERPE